MSEEVELDEDFHAKLSPSSGERWIACPGSVKAQADMPPQPDDTNEHSRLGTAAHALLEASFVFGRQPEDFIGVQLVNDSHPVVDEDMCDWVSVALDYVYEYIDMYGAENLIVLPETRLFIGSVLNITGDEEADDMICNGTGDFVIAHRDMSMCVVMDYKNGKNRVEATENPQTMLYGVGAKKRLGAFKRYKSVIVQPRAGKRSPIDEWEYPAARQRKFIEIASKSARAAMQPNPPRVAGPHCSWCRANTRCRTYKDKVWASARVEFAALPDEPDPELLSLDEVAEVLKYAPMIKSYLGKMEQYAQRVLSQDPKAIPDFELGWGRRERKWQDQAGIIEVCEREGLDVDQYMPRSLLSPAEMQKLLQRHLRPRAVPGKRRKKQPPVNYVEPYVTYTVPPIKVVPRNSENDLEALDDDI